jgi:predicted amidophosphoribosyltransferase
MRGFGLTGAARVVRLLISDDLPDLVLGSRCVGCDSPGRALCTVCGLGLAGPARLAAPTPAPPGLPLVWATSGYGGVVRAALIAHKERGRVTLAAPLGAALALAIEAATASTATSPMATNGTAPPGAMPARRGTAEPGPRGAPDRGRTPAAATPDRRGHTVPPGMAIVSGTAATPSAPTGAMPARRGTAEPGPRGAPDCGRTPAAATADRRGVAVPPGMAIASGTAATPSAPPLTTPAHRGTAAARGSRVAATSDTSAGIAARMADPACATSPGVATGATSARTTAADVELLIVPVPSAARAVRERGYDPMLAIARQAVRQLRRSGHPARLVRPVRLNRRVADQTELGAAERMANLAGAFSVPKRHRPTVAGRRVVLVDDLMTTGATLHAVAAALSDAGARVMAAAVVAATPRDSGT